VLPQEPGQHAAGERLGLPASGQSVVVGRAGRGPPGSDLPELDREPLPEPEAMRRRVPRWAVAAAIAVSLLGARAGWSQRSVDDAIFPLAQYKAQDRPLAQTYL